MKTRQFSALFFISLEDIHLLHWFTMTSYRPIWICSGQLIFAELWPMGWEIYCKNTVSALFFIMLAYHVHLIFGTFLYYDKFYLVMVCWFFAEFWPLDKENSCKNSVFCTFFCHACRYILDILYFALLWWVTDQGWILFFFLFFCWVMSLEGRKFMHLTFPHFFMLTN